jgi:hypothetical protein
MKIDDLCNANNIAFVSVHEVAFENAQLIILSISVMTILSTHVVMRSLSVTCYVWITFAIISLVFNE